MKKALIFIIILTCLSFAGCANKTKTDPYSIYAGTYYNQFISWYHIYKLDVYGKAEEVAPKTQNILTLNNDGTGYTCVKVIKEDCLGLVKVGTIVSESSNLTWRVESGKIITKCKVRYLIDNDTGAEKSGFFDIDDDTDYIIIDEYSFYPEGYSNNIYIKGN